MNRIQYFKILPRPSKEHQMILTPQNKNIITFHFPHHLHLFKILFLKSFSKHRRELSSIRVSRHTISTQLHISIISSFPSSFGPYLNCRNYKIPFGRKLHPSPSFVRDHLYISCESFARVFWTV